MKLNMIFIIKFLYMNIVCIKTEIQYVYSYRIQISGVRFLARWIV